MSNEAREPDLGGAVGRMRDMMSNRAGTYWNGEPAIARRVFVTVEPYPAARAYWARDIVGTEVEAVEVLYAGELFYLFDGPYVSRVEDVPEEYREAVIEARGTEAPIRFRRGSAWAKVTAGRGSPQYGHRSIMAVSGVRERGER